MGHYIIIETRDPSESQDTQSMVETAKGLSAHGHRVTMFLIQNGVMPARRGSTFQHGLTTLQHANVKILADRHSLQERAITEVGDDIERTDMDHLVDLLMEPHTKAFWH